MIEKLLTELEQIDFSNDEFIVKYNILIKNTNNMSIEQLKRFKILILKKMEKDYKSFDCIIERIK